MINLTDIQKKLLEFALEKGYLHFNDFSIIYTSKYALKDVISRFITLGLITPDIGNRFKINEDLIEQCLMK